MTKKNPETMEPEAVKGLKDLTRQISKALKIPAKAKRASKRRESSTSKQAGKPLKEIKEMLEDKIAIETLEDFHDRQLKKKEEAKKEKTVKKKDGFQMPQKPVIIPPVIAQGSDGEGKPDPSYMQSIALSSMMAQNPYLGLIMMLGQGNMFGKKQQNDSGNQMKETLELVKLLMSMQPQQPVQSSTGMGFVKPLLDSIVTQQRQMFEMMTKVQQERSQMKEELMEREIRQLKGMISYDPLEQLKDLGKWVDTIKGISGKEDPEIKKLNMEMEKWKTEQELSLRREAMEQEKNEKMFDMVKRGIGEVGKILASDAGRQVKDIMMNKVDQQQEMFKMVDLSEDIEEVAPEKSKEKKDDVFYVSR